MKPTCRRCKRNGRRECVWPPPSSAFSESGSQPNHAVDAADSSPYPSLTSDTSLLRPPQSRVSVIADFPCLSHIPTGSFWFLAQQCNHVMHGAYFDDRYTLLVPTIPLLEDCPPLLHAWVACSSILVSQWNSGNHMWREIALRYRGKALRGLAQALTISRTPEAWMLAVILILHMFEKFGDDPHQPSYIHMASACNIFVRQFMEVPPVSLHSVLQLQCLIYRIAVTSTFHTQGHIDFDSVDKLVQLCPQVTAQSELGIWQHSLWVDMPLTVFDTVYKLSFLLRQAPLNATFAAALNQIEDTLKELHESSSMVVAVTACSGHTLASLEQSHASQYLYTCACLILAAKLRDLSTTADYPSTREVTKPAIQVIRHLTATHLFSPILLWPVTVIGIAAITAERIAVREYVTCLEHVSGSKTVASVLNFFASIWDKLDLDVLFNNELLSMVFL